jgi:hypothetical protein
MARAGGDAETARAAFEDAVDLWHRIGAPYELGRAHRVLRDLGD